jgi:hypothetical protein
MNATAELLWEWRESIVKAILTPVVKDEEEDADGEEYASGAELQESLDVQLEAYQLLLCVA